MRYVRYFLKPAADRRACALFCHRRTQTRRILHCRAQTRRWLAPCPLPLPSLDDAKRAFIAEWPERQVTATRTEHLAWNGGLRF